ncbi:restriction system protein [Opitutus sp. GAS368]|nr:restriction system protein [Opitutus sp. GAS368]
MGFLYNIEIKHDGLGKHRVITGSNREIVQSKARAQMAEWDAKYSMVRSKVDARRGVEDKVEQAVKETEKARQAIDELQTLLSAVLDIKHAIDWESLKERPAFLNEPPKRPELLGFPREPKPSDVLFEAKLGLLDMVFSTRAEKKNAEAKAKYEMARVTWGKAVERLRQANKESMQTYENEVAAYNAEKQAFEETIASKNAGVDEQRKRYLNKEISAIHDYCDLVLSRSQYPDSFPKEWAIEYQAESKTIIIDYKLPNIDQLPRIKEVKYIKARDEFKETQIGQAECNALYDDVLYQLCLRSVFELFRSDVIGAVDAAGFNGMVTAIDRSTGQTVTACIISLHVTRAEFEKLNWWQIDPKTCFRSLKGVGSSKLHVITPVAPILQLNRKDSRFVSAHAVADSLDSSFNLAAMDWEEFEHLIREVFESEFKSTGGEVKVTQASRDGGVDAIAFDPDPIRGGKIIIQAKRYTNTVGVSAVRDLYGTLMNEGANKGILVTTSDFGPDAFEFAKGKPLTLMNGGNLLFLLEKHGHRAKIDIKEAKQILAEQQPKMNGTSAMG